MSATVAPVGNPRQRDIPVQVMLFPTERRRLDALMCALGRNPRGRATLLRELLLQKLDEAGVKDPALQDSTDSAEAQAEVIAA